MIQSLSQEALTQYASNAQTIQEPAGTDYSQGVKVGKTIPAKWWNWLFSAVTKRIVQSRNDADNMLTELKNVVTDAGLIPSGSDSTQLTQAVVAKANTQIDEYVINKKGFYLEWSPSSKPVVPTDYQYELHSANGGRFAVRIYSYASSTGNTYSWHIFITTDGVTWHKFTPDSSIGQYHVVCSICYFKGAYFLLVQATDIASSQRVLSGRLYKSIDLDNWELVDSWDDEHLGGKSNEYASIVYDEDTLRVIISSGNTTITTYVKTTTDGETWQTLALSDPVGVTTSASVTYMHPEPFFTTTNGFIIGNIYINSSTGTVIRLFDTGYGYDYCRVVKLKTGRLVIGSLISSTKWYTVEAGGTTATERTAATSGHIVGSISDDTYVVRQTSDDTQISSDGLTFTSIGTSSSASLYELNGAYFQGNKKSTNLTDWEVIPELSENYTIYACIEQHNVLMAYVPFTTNCKVSADGGNSWHVPHQYQPIAANSFTGFVLGDSCYSIGGTDCYVTQSGVNRVIGHTLYLR